MCNTYNTIGSLTTLKSHQENHKIHDFGSLKEVMEFQASYASSRQRIILQHKNLIEQEKSALSSDLNNLELAIASQKQNTKQQLNDEIENLKKQLNNLRNSISTNFIQNHYSSFKKWNIKRQINQHEETFIISASESTSDLTRVLQVNGIYLLKFRNGL